MCGLGFTISATSAVDALKRALLAALTPRGPDAQATACTPLCGAPAATALLCATVLHMRGTAGPTPQPLALAGGLELCYNGEIFGGGVAVPQGGSDTRALGLALGSALAQCGAAAAQLPRLLAVQRVAQQVHGPYAFLLWDAARCTLYFARDAQGRRSLLWNPAACASAAAGAEGVLYIGSAAVEGVEGLEEVPPRGVYALQRRSGGGGQGALWECAGLGGWECVLAPFAPPLASLCRQPSLAACSAGAAQPPLLPADALALAASGLLRALSAAVRVRVLPGAPDLPPCAAPPALPLPPTDLWAFPGPPPPVASALARLAAGGWAPPPPPGPTSARVAVLFSGGLDCMVLAALAHQHIALHEPIDLITVDFSQDRRSPDRLSAVDGLHELAAACPGRIWNLLCVDEAYENLLQEEAMRVTRECVHPLRSHLDYNLAFCLGAGARGVGYLHTVPPGEGPAPVACNAWEAVEDAALQARICDAISAPFAAWRASCLQGAEAALGASAAGTAQGAAGKGAARAQKGPGRGRGAQQVVKSEREDTEEGREEGLPLHPAPHSGTPAAPRLLVRTCARILLSGLGADEWLGGYSRHRSVFQRSGWEGLEREMGMDAARLWQRNLGRDDRVVAWHGREVRWPYLDEESVLPFLALLPLHALCDMRLPSGVGDKRLLRGVAEMLGLPRAAARVKRAMHRGTRCVKHSDAAAAAAAGEAGCAGVTADTPFTL